MKNSNTAPPSAPVGVDGLVAGCRVLLEQYEASGDFTMGGKLTNRPFMMIRYSMNELSGNSGQLPALAQQPAAVVLSREELNTCRQWFDSVQDTNGGYLTPDDYVLAEKLYRSVGMRVPDSIGRIAAQPGGSDNDR